MTNKSQVLELHRKHPDWGCTSIAAELGTSREYVYATLRRAGIVPVGKREVCADPRELRNRAAVLYKRADALVARAKKIEEKS